MENDPKSKLIRKIHEMKVNNLVNNFVKKVTLNSTARDPVEFSPFEEKEDTSENLNGLEIPSLLNSVFYVLSIINTIVMLVIASISIIFEDAMSSQGVTNIQIWAALWLLVEIVVNFVKVSYSNGYYKLEKIKEIAKHYVKSRFGLDLICFVGLMIEIIFDFKLSVLLRLNFLLKLPDCLEKI